MECAMLPLRQKEDRLRCFRRLAARDKDEPNIHRKCNTCSCEQLRRMDEKFIEDPAVHDMFCFTGNRNSY